MNRSLNGFLLVALQVCCVFSAAQTTHHKPTTPTGGASCGIHCGVERWAIKTLTDADGAKVAAVTPVAASVTKLTQETAPKKLPQNTRIAPVENQQVTVKALLIAWKEEAGAKGDRDFHLVLADPDDHTKTVIAEIPSPDCASACSSVGVTSFKAARGVLTTELGAAPQTKSATPIVPPRIVEVTGVTFFDFDHHQDGLAPNCIEIHPVLKIAVQGTEGGSAIPLPTGVTHTCGKTGTAPAGGHHRRPTTHN